MDRHIQTTILVLLGLMFAFGFFHRLRAAQSGESLNRRAEGWPILIGIRAVALLAAIQVVLRFWNPRAMDWAALPLPVAARWGGVVILGLAAAWLCWMFVSLGRNLTDTVVTRKAAQFVEHGPYRYVRNPMYTGLLVLGLGLGIALGNWSIPATFACVFTLLAIRTRTEEAHLIARFGDVYRDYMRRVGRFLPKWS